MSNYITTRTIEKIKINENGRIFKPWTEDEKNKRGYIEKKLKILDILATYNFDFFPNILAWDEKGYSYEYIKGMALNNYISSKVYNDTKGRVSVYSVEVFEHGSNSAIYINPYGSAI